jgi:ATP-dependent Clp protease adaptor protein ClpS
MEKDLEGLVYKRYTTESMSHTTTINLPAIDTDQQTRFAPLYNLVLLDDDHHSYDYVIFMLMKLFGFPISKAYQCALEVDSSGRVILKTGAKEPLELKQEQIHGYGPDPSIRACSGAMSAIIEPAPSP